MRVDIVKNIYNVLKHIALKEFVLGEIHFYTCLHFMTRILIITSGIVKEESPVFMNNWLEIMIVKCSTEG
jgi:hypothetical protein